MIPFGGAIARENDMVEIDLLLPANQVSALEVAAVRAGLSVAALVRRVVSDFLQSTAAGGFVGEVAGRPTAPLTPEGIR
jgi:hypothetical protein